MPNIGESELTALEEVVAHPAEPELKVALSKVALEVNSRVQAGSASSSEYMESVIRTLKKLSGASHPELRINFFIDASPYFYIVVKPFNAIEPATALVHLPTT